ncbi:MAG: nuclear transport factor 2 family protein [Kiloniellaceae bacterium]
MSQRAELLFANEAFYHAFRNRDVDGMEALWAARQSVACIHPGWQALTSREEVMESWRGILSNPESPKIACRGARGFLTGEAGFVVCYEQIGDTVLVATNVFVREDGAWKLVHHQAGPCNVPLADLGDEPEAAPLQ